MFELKSAATSVGRYGLALIAACFAAQSYGAEGPVVDVTIESVQQIYTATHANSTVPGFKPHVNFPWMEQRGDGSLLAWWTVGQTHGPGRFGAASQSFDDGDTWTPTATHSLTPAVTQMRPPGQQSKGFELNWTNPTPRTSWAAPRYTSTDGGHVWTGGTAFYSSGGVGYVYLYQQQGPIVQRNNELLFTAFGQRNASDTTYESVLFASTDGGLNWTRRSTIASYIPGLNVSMGSEGPSETAFIELDNGNLLSVFRTGQPYPNSNINAVSPSIFSSISSDGGYTWSTPKMLGVVGVSPHLNRLPDGTIAMTYGRAGVKMLFADPTGTRWSFPFVVMDESTSGHVRMYEREDGDWILAYDRSSFYHPNNNNNPPAGYVYANDQMAHMEIAKLSITLKTVVEDYDWDFEYHGDVAPDMLAVPWTYHQVGTASVRLWGESGQDYIRTDSGTSGPHRLSYYSLSGETTSSPWASVDFANGFVLDIRARAGTASTGPSSASVLIGDGQNGYISLELTSNYVGLEGLGGNDGQVDYSPAGFSARDWHHYRLVVDTDDETGLVTSRLFMDGNWNDPILTQLLDPVLIDEIRFGDQTGESNGVLDIDFLRFASLSSPILHGDFNDDGVVDAADYVVWRDNLGAEDESSLNGNGDGMDGVGQGDYALWKAHFGATSHATANVATPAMPELSSQWLLILGIMLAAIERSIVSWRKRVTTSV